MTKQHPLQSAGARVERRALRDAIRRELVKHKGGRVDPGLRWVMDWLSERVQRTRKPGGVGR
jgi:hypothetical protein